MSQLTTGGCVKSVGRESDDERQLGFQARSNFNGIDAGQQISLSQSAAIWSRKKQ